MDCLPLPPFQCHPIKIIQPPKNKFPFLGGPHKYFCLPSLLRTSYIPFEQGRTRLSVDLLSFCPQTYESEYSPNSEHICLLHSNKLCINPSFSRGGLWNFERGRRSSLCCNRPPANMLAGGLGTAAPRSQRFLYSFHSNFWPKGRVRTPLTSPCIRAWVPGKLAAFYVRR